MDFDLDDIVEDMAEGLADLTVAATPDRVALLIAIAVVLFLVWASC